MRKIDSSVIINPRIALTIIHEGSQICDGVRLSFEVGITHPLLPAMWFTRTKKGGTAESDSMYLSTRRSIALGTAFWFLRKGTHPMPGDSVLPGKLLPLGEDGLFVNRACFVHNLYRQMSKRSTNVVSVFIDNGIYNLHEMRWSSSLLDSLHCVISHFIPRSRRRERIIHKFNQLWPELVQAQPQPRPTRAARTTRYEDAYGHIIERLEPTTGPEIVEIVDTR